jgi:hypothetical protein
LFNLESSDYDLNLEERKTIHKNYINILLCEKCNNEIYNWNYCCTVYVIIHILMLIKRLYEIWLVQILELLIHQFIIHDH